MTTTIVIKPNERFYNYKISRSPQGSFVYNTRRACRNRIIRALPESRFNRIPISKITDVFRLNLHDIIVLSPEHVITFAPLELLSSFALVMRSRNHFEFGEWRQTSYGLNYYPVITARALETFRFRVVALCRLRSSRPTTAFGLRDRSRGKRAPRLVSSSQPSRRLKVPSRVISQFADTTFYVIIS